MAEHPESNTNLGQLISMFTKAMTTEGPRRSALFDLPADKVAALKRDVETIRLTIRSAANQAVPVGRLPPKILAKVLEFRRNDKDLISATHVCTQWRSVLTSAPSLWTKVEFRDPSRALAYLTRSGTAPIDVSFTTTPDSSKLWPFYPKDYYTNRIPWFDRVQSILLGGGDEQIEATLRRLCPSAPLLRSLKLNGISRWISTPWRTPGAVRSPGKLLGGQAPSLRNISLHSISPALICKLPSANLTSLTWIGTFSDFPVCDLLPLLGSAPLLEVLTLDLRIQSVPTVERTMTLRLNKLRELTWLNSEGPFSLTSCLSAPELRSLTLRVEQALRADHASILPPHQGRFPLLADPTQITYFIKWGTWSCQLKSPTSSIIVSEVAGKVWDVHPWFFRNKDTSIPFKKIKHMTIDVNSHPLGVFPTEWFEGLETLELVDGGNDYFTLIQPNSRGGNPIVPFPALREVSISFNTASSTRSLAGLAKILEQRKQAGREVDTVRIWGKRNEDINKAIAKIRKSVGLVLG